MAALVGRDAVVDHTQLVLEQGEPLGDEVGGVGRDLVLVLNPLVVVDLDDGAEHLVGILWGVVGVTEVDDG